MQGHVVYLYNYGISIATVKGYGGITAQLSVTTYSLENNGAGNNTARTLLSICLHCTETELGIDYLNTGRPIDQIAN
jgi:hypothetical protein